VQWQNVEANAERKQTLSIALQYRLGNARAPSLSRALVTNAARARSLSLTLWPRWVQGCGKRHTARETGVTETIKVLTTLMPTGETARERCFGSCWRWQRQNQHVRIKNAADSTLLLSTSPVGSCTSGLRPWTSLLPSTLNPKP
jgi:hypothetical protein